MDYSAIYFCYGLAAILIVTGCAVEDGWPGILFGVIIAIGISLAWLVGSVPTPLMGLSTVDIMEVSRYSAEENGALHVDGRANL